MSVIKTDLPCPVCESPHSGSIYKNKEKDTGEPFYMYQCFSVWHGDKRFNKRIEDPDNYEEELMKPNSTSITSSAEGSSTPTKHSGIFDRPTKYVDLTDPNDPWGYRGLSSETLSYYGVGVSFEAPQTQSTGRMAAWTAKGGSPTGKAIVFPYYDQLGNLVTQKVRTAVDVKGAYYKSSDTEHSKRGFFGQNLFRSGVVKDIVITFGEFDAMAVYQMTGQAAISVCDGDASAQALFKKEYAWLNKFERITLIPDNDPSGKAIIPLLGSIFPRKTRIVHLSKYKDACEYLQNKERDLFVREFYASQPYSPEKIISLSGLKHLLFDDPPVPIADYPWEGLNKVTGGIWPGELVTIKARPKIGKSTIIGEIVHHLKETVDQPIGLIYLEETQRDLIFKFATLTLNKNLQRPEIRATVSKEELIGAAEEFLASDNVFLVDHFGSCSSDFLEEKITELVLAKGCQFIFFDHISMAITDESNKDERIALDRLITAIKALTVGIPDEVSETVKVKQPDGTFLDKIENKVIMRQPTIFMVTHVNDNGQPRGSRAALQISNTIIDLQRDKLSGDKLSKNTTNIVVEENRRMGESGLACQLLYNRDTGRLSEIPTVDPHENDTPVMDSTPGKYIYEVK